MNLLVFFLSIILFIYSIKTKKFMYLMGVLMIAICIYFLYQSGIAKGVDRSMTFAVGGFLVGVLGLGLIYSKR